jgi:hypothetical protein
MCVLDADEIYGHDLSNGGWDSSETAIRITIESSQTPWPPAVPRMRLPIFSRRASAMRMGLFVELRIEYASHLGRRARYTMARIEGTTEPDIVIRVVHV